MDRQRLRILSLLAAAVLAAAGSSLRALAAHPRVVWIGLWIHASATIPATAFLVLTAMSARSPYVRIAAAAATLIPLTFIGMMVAAYL